MYVYSITKISKLNRSDTKEKVKKGESCLLKTQMELAMDLEKSVKRLFK